MLHVHGRRLLGLGAGAKARACAPGAAQAGGAEAGGAQANVVGPVEPRLLAGGAKARLVEHRPPWWI